MYEFKPCLKYHWENAKFSIFYIIGAIAFPIYMVYRFGPEDTDVFIRYALIGFSIFFIPQLLLHLRYYYLNKGYVFYYYPNEWKIKIRTGKGEETEFSLDDVDKIKYFKSKPLAEDRMQWFPWDNYSYARIYLKNGKQFLITSLVVPNMNLPVEAQKIRLRKTFYAYPLKKEAPFKEKRVKEERKYRNW